MPLSFHDKSSTKLNYCIGYRRVCTSLCSTQSFDTSRYSISIPSTTESTVLQFSRCSWISWWVQIILSVISGVILTFANSVRVNSDKGILALWTSGFAFSAAGVFISLLSSIWTWNMTRISKRISKKKMNKNVILPTLKKYSKISVVLSLIGMFITLLGAEQIVGTLASKVLSSPNYFPQFTSTTPQGVQALDIFLVQANTNVLVSHFASLVCYLYVQTQLPQLRFLSPPNNDTNDNIDKEPQTKLNEA